MQEDKNDIEMPEGWSAPKPEPEPSPLPEDIEFPDITNADWDTLEKLVDEHLARNEKIVELMNKTNDPKEFYKIKAVWEKGRDFVDKLNDTMKSMVEEKKPLSQRKNEEEGEPLSEEKEEEEEDPLEQLGIDISEFDKTDEIYDLENRIFDVAKRLNNAKSFDEKFAILNDHPDLSNQLQKLHEPYIEKAQKLIIDKLIEDTKHLHKDQYQFFKNELDITTSADLLKEVDIPQVKKNLFNAARVLGLSGDALKKIFRGGLSFFFEKSYGGSYSKFGGKMRIHLNKEDISQGNIDYERVNKILFHELGHGFEYQYPQTNKTQGDFLRSIATGDKIITMEKLTGTKDPDLKDLPVIPTKLKNPYANRVYGPEPGDSIDSTSITYELLTTGMENFSTAKDLYHFMENEPEHFRFVLKTILRARKNESKNKV